MKQKYVIYLKFMPSKQNQIQDGGNGAVAPQPLQVI
jgi:hypothetical protein